MISIAVVQSFFLAAAQVALKLAVSSIGSWGFSWRLLFSTLTNVWFILMGGCFAVAGLLWLYMLKCFPFSIAYPMTSLAYVFGTVAAMFLWGEEVSLMRWVGIGLIVLGVVFVSR